MLNPKFTETYNLVVFLEKPEESDGFEEIIDILNATLVDKKKVIITETSIRSDFKLDDVEGIYCLPTATIFAELERMRHKKVYVTPSHTKKVFKKKSMRKQRKDGGPIEPVTNEAYVSTPSYDPPQSEKVLDLEKAKTAQAKEIASLKKRVKQLEKRMTLRTPGLKRLRKVGSTSKVESSNDKEKEIVEKEVSIADPVTTTDEVVTTANVEATTANAPTKTVNELTLDQTLIEIEAAKPKAITSAATTTTTTRPKAQTLIEIKASKPKVVTSASTTTTTTRPKARGVVVQEPSEFKTTSSPLQASQLLQAKDKGKEIMVKPKRLLKKKDQVAL
ncbi:hypothetical protein Tco_0285739, partial [Tanacetum coccineum]